MAKGSGPNARESGTGQDTHKMCVPVPPRPLPCGTRRDIVPSCPVVPRRAANNGNLTFWIAHRGRPGSTRPCFSGGGAIIAAVRVPLSRACGGDIVLPLMSRELCLEVKARADGFRELYGWPNKRDALVVKADRQKPLVIVRLSLAEIAKPVA
jgi:hypothetical protein